MKYNFTTFITLVCIILFTNCVSHFIQHSPKQAISEALTFSTKAFVNHNYPEAYQMLRKDISPDFTVEKLKELVVGMHPSGEFPKAIIPLEYEPVPGQKQINIYLYGESPNEKHYYQIVMVGTEQEGYSVSALYRRTEPFPDSGLKRNKIEKKKS